MYSCCWFTIKAEIFCLCLYLHFKELGNFSITLKNLTLLYTKTYLSTAWFHELNAESSLHLKSGLAWSAIHPGSWIEMASLQLVSETSLVVSVKKAICAFILVFFFLKAYENLRKESEQCLNSTKTPQRSQPVFVSPYARTVWSGFIVRLSLSPDGHLYTFRFCHLAGHRYNVFIILYCQVNSTRLH